MDDDFNWGDFDSQAADYLNSDAYQGSAFQTEDGMSWGGQGANLPDWTGSSQPQGSFNQGMNDYYGNFGNFSGMEGLPQNTFDFGMGGGNQQAFQQSPFGANQGLPQSPQEASEGTMNWGNLGSIGSIGSMLSKIFANPSSSRLATTGLAALMEGNQNKQKQQAMQSLVQNNQQYIDPFGSQRGFYQQQLQDSINNPYGSKIVSDQVNALKAEQARRNAAAGRRSNSATTDPALLAAMANVAMKYQNQLMQPAGANINPSSAIAMGLLNQGTNAGINGYVSPLASAVGYNQKMNDLSSLLGQ